MAQLRTYSGNEKILGTLNVVGAVDFDSTLNVDGIATFRTSTLQLKSTAEALVEIVEVPDVGTTQTITIDVVYTSTGGRTFMTEIELICGSSGSTAVYASLFARVSWVCQDTTAIIRNYELDYEISGTETVTLSAITEGIRIVISSTAFGGTMNRNSLRVTTVGRIANLIATTVTIT